MIKSIRVIKNDNRCCVDGKYRNYNTTPKLPTEVKRVTFIHVDSKLNQYVKNGGTNHLKAIYR